MGIFSNLGKRQDDNVGIPDVDAWLQSDDDDDLETDALMDMPPPPQPEQFIGERRAEVPVVEVPESLAPVADDGEQALWNLPDVGDANGISETADNFELDAPASLPSIAEIQQTIPPAGFGGLEPVSDAAAPASTGFEGLSTAVSGASTDHEIASNDEDVRWDVDVVKYEPEIPDALKPAEASFSPTIPMPVTPPADMEIPGPAVDFSSTDTSFETPDVPEPPSTFVSDFDASEDLFSDEPAFAVADNDTSPSFEEMSDSLSDVTADDHVVSPAADEFAAAAEPSDSDAAGFSLSSFFGRKGKKDEADGFADLREPVADDPFGDNIGMGIADAPTETLEETTAPSFSDDASVPLAEPWGVTDSSPAADDLVDEEPLAPPMPGAAIVAPPAPDLMPAATDVVPAVDEYASIYELNVPEGPQAAEMLEILGLDQGSTWGQARDARRLFLAEHNPDDATDEERAALAKAICREMNTAYAALRLLHVA